MTTVAPEILKTAAREIIADYPSAVLSGIVPDQAHLDDGGYHVSIDDLRRYGNAGDYSNRNPLDVSPPVTVEGRKLAAALDISVSKTDMRRMFVNVERVWKARATDTRAKYINAINVWSTIAGQAPTRFNFVRGTRESANISHTWHEHGDLPRVYVDVNYNRASAERAGRALVSIMVGQTHDAWQRQEKIGPYAPQPAPPVPTTPEEDDMTSTSYSLPTEYGYDAKGAVLPLVAGTLSVALPPAGRADHWWGKNYRLYLSLAGDHLPAAGEQVRVAINDGKAWTVKTYTVKSGARVSIPVPAAQNGAAYNITAGRVMPADAPAELVDAEVPGALGSVALLAEILRTA